MIKATRVGHTIVCFINEKMYQKAFNSEEELIPVYELILNTSDSDPDEIENLKLIFAPPKTFKEIKQEEEFKRLKEEQTANASLLAWMEKIKNEGDNHFEVKGISLYLKGIGISIPEFLAVEFLSRREREEDLQSLINFWRLLSLNSDPRCREDLYKFLINNKMVVTPSGYFLAYRNANIKQKGSNNELFEFVNASWAKVKGQKKSPKNYKVFECAEDAIAVDRPKYVFKQESLLSKWFGSTDVNYTEIGNLQELYDSLQNEEEKQTIYTDAHSGSTTIIIGQPVRIEREQCDANPNETCSKGLHLGSTNFMTKDYFGSVGLVCLCNPMNVVAVPYTDGQKLRTCEYLPIGIAEYGEDGKIIPIQSDTFEYDYAEYTEDQLNSMLSETHFESLKDHKILPLEITYEQFKEIVGDLALTTKEMKETIEKRIVKV